MPVQELTPYVFFNGTAEKAIRFYERTLGATAEGLQRWADLPATTGTCAPQDRERVMHSLVRIGQARLMISDVPSSMPERTGGNVHICLDFDDADDMTRKFEALAQSGEVTMGIHDTFWGARFGTLTDEFGVHWMFNCANQAA